MRHHNAAADIITCRECGERKPRAHKKRGRICQECYPDKSREYARKYKRTEKGREWRREWRRKQRAKSPASVVADNCRRAVRRALDGAKSARTEYYLGYPVSRLVEWAKANGYNPPHNHIDHRVPVSFFLGVFHDDPVRALRAAWNITNLQVIPARDNIAKGARRDHLI